MAWKWVTNSRIGRIQAPLYIKKLHLRTFTEVFGRILSALGWWSLRQLQLISSCCKFGRLDINRRVLPMIEHDWFRSSSPRRLRSRVWTKLHLELTTFEYWRSCLGDLIDTLQLKYLVALCDHVLHTRRHGQRVAVDVNLNLSWSSARKSIIR